MRKKKMQYIVLHYEEKAFPQSGEKENKITEKIMETFDHSNFIQYCSLEQFNTQEIARNDQKTHAQNVLICNTTVIDLQQKICN